MINFVDSGNNKNTKGRRKRRFKCGKCLGTLTCMSSVLICCILLTVRNMYKLGNGVSWFDRKLSGKSNKLRFREKLIDHYLLVPLLSSVAGLVESSLFISARETRQDFGFCSRLILLLSYH